MNIGGRKIYTYTVADEQELLKQLSEGNSDAFDKLYTCLQPKVYAYIYPFTIHTTIDANDIVQDIFVKLWMKKNALAGLQSLEYYLYRMARNRLIDLKRSSDVQQNHYKQISVLLPTSADTTMFDVQYREFSKRALQVIEKLPERRRLIFDMSINEDLSLAEIAEKLQISVSVVKKQLYLASNVVKEYIKTSKLIQMLLSLILF